jgi:hypothetical protein
VRLQGHVVRDGLLVGPVRPGSEVELPADGFGGVELDQGLDRPSTFFDGPSR